MPNEFEQALRAAPSLLLAVSYAQIATLGAKTLPLLFVVCYPAKGRRAAALLWVAVGGLICLLVASQDDAFFARSALALGTLCYYVVATASAFWLSALLRSGALRRDTLFLLLGFVFIIAPAAVLRRLGQVELLVLGWSITLSVYSYCVETSRTSRATDIREYLFFALIDPTLSFADRSRPALVSGRVVRRRVALGLLLMVLGDRLLRGWQAALLWLDDRGIELGWLLTSTLATPVAFFVAYWVRAGSAHIRIGMMQSLGYQPPECFNRPYLASDPSDFWRRWNCWVGDWVRRYLFVPLALKLLRQKTAYGVSSATAQRVAVLGSFILMGLLHDWLIFANQGELTFVYLRVFVFAACGLLAWEAIADAWRKHKPQGQAEVSSWRRMTLRLGPVAYVAALLAIGGRI